jgi:hypothetical protein
MDAKFVEPTYRLKPHEELKFSPPAVARISEEVVKAMLSDKKWIGEGEEAVWTVQITEQVKSKVIGERGVGKDIDLVVWRASRRETKKTSHLPSTPNFPFSLSPPPFPHLSALNFPRYKIVVQTVMGQSAKQGVRVASRCLWDVEADNVSSYTYNADTLWVTVMVFGLYVE